MGARTEIEAIIKLRDEFSAKVSKIDKRLGDVDRSLKRAKSSTAGFAGSLKRGALQAASFGGAAGIAAAATSLLIKAVGDGVREFIAFEKSMVRIETLVGLSRDEVDSMNDSVRAIAEATGRGPQELSEALFQITSAGLRGEDALNTLNAAAKASAVGLGSTAVVADIATSAMNAFGAGNINAEQAVGVLLKAVREGKASPEELAASLGRVIPIAASMGISFSEVSGIVASMTKVGLKSAESVTSLRGAMFAILKPTEQAKEVLKTVGLSMADVRKVIREDGLLDAFQLLRTSLSGEAFAKFVGRAEALTGVLAVTGERFEDTSRIVLSTADSIGELDTATARVNETTAQQAAQLTQVWANAKRDIGGFVVSYVLAAKSFSDNTRSMFAALVSNVPVLRDVFTGVEDLSAAFDRGAAVTASFEVAEGNLNAALEKQRRLFSDLDKDIEDLAGTSTVSFSEQVAAIRASGAATIELKKDADFLILGFKEFNELLAENTDEFAEQVRVARIADEVMNKTATETLPMMSERTREITALIALQREEQTLWAALMGEKFVEAGSASEAFGEVVVDVGSGVVGQAQLMEAAFAQFGLQTQAQFDATHTKAVAAFAIIRASSQFTTEELDRMWSEYEEARLKASEENTKFTREQGLQVVSDAFGGLAQLGGRFKVFSIGQALINTFLAITKSLTTLPWPFSLIAAAGAAAAGFAQVSKIRAQGFRHGTPGLDFQEFGTLAPAVLHGREAVIPEGGGHRLGREVATELGSLADGGGSTINVTNQFMGVVFADEFQFDEEVVRKTKRAFEENTMGIQGSVKG